MKPSKVQSNASIIKQQGEALRRNHILIEQLRVDNEILKRLAAQQIVDQARLECQKIHSEQENEAVDAMMQASGKTGDLARCICTNLYRAIKSGDIEIK